MCIHMTSSYILSVTTVSIISQLVHGHESHESQHDTPRQGGNPSDEGNLAKMANRKLTRNVLF